MNYRSTSHHSKEKGGRKKAQPYIYKCGDQAVAAI